ncbi:GTPase ObgE [Candidatus Roizmanbacteria bacterium]|nr:GTPase ObgE [Candidatus Roizmanbacteria bacterium]
MLYTFSKFMLIDEAEITVKGGNGGAGKVAFFPMKKGPSGGNGGNGGDVYLVADNNTGDLKKYVERITFQAGSGAPGGRNNRLGADGEDLVLPVPIGTTLIDPATNEEVEIGDISTRVLVCQGGTGGLGNDAFKTPTNRVPRHATPGQEGQVRQLKLILKLIADYGLIGLPNAGKSSLLNALTAANVRTAAYPFTTLEPNLGVYKGRIIADIPGLIEGASQGKGLGIRFLKHIEKVALLLHCVSVEGKDLVKDYQTVLTELANYNKSLLKKEAVILLTKTDLISETELQNKTAQLKTTGKKILPVSLLVDDSLVKLKKVLQSDR